MLSRLSIRDIVLIEQLDLDFRSGMTVLTGETGAGKSILLDALSLALGARGDGSLVRSGRDQGQVAASFEMADGHPVAGLLKENAIVMEGVLILHRVQNADGRTKAFVNDRPVSVALLREIGQSLVELHGQHDDRALVDRSAHRKLLDLFGRCENLAEHAASAWSSWKQAERKLSRLRERAQANAREADYLRSSVRELAELAPEPGEETALADARARMMKIEKLATDLSDAREELAGPASPIPALSSLLRRLERKGGELSDLLGGALEALDNAVNQLHIAQEELERAVREAEYDPRELERTEERLFALRAAARKYSVPVDQLSELAVRLSADLQTLDAGETQIEELAERVISRRESYFKHAKRLSAKRGEAAKKLRERVEVELPALKLENSAFIVEMESSSENAGPGGLDEIEFYVQTNPGSRPGPLVKVASGGELSRFLLALKVSLADHGSAPTLIFDEIDAGAGGAVADAIGRRLARLAENVQVLSVTHAPQVAARASNHYLISKMTMTGEAQRAATQVRLIEKDQRREEIARMLAGATITEEARAAAERLISQTAA